MKLLVGQRFNWCCVERSLAHFSCKPNRVFGNNGLPRTRWRGNQNTLTCINAVKSLNLKCVEFE